MKDPKPEEIKELKINETIVCKYCMDKFSGGDILFIKILKTFNQKECDLENFYTAIIELVEGKTFAMISYLNIK